MIATAKAAAFAGTVVASAAAVGSTDDSTAFAVAAAVAFLGKPAPHRHRCLYSVATYSQ